MRLTKGFSLTEMLVAVGIVAIIAALSVPAWTQRVRLERENALKRELISTRTAVRQYRADCGIWPESLETLTFQTQSCVGFTDDGQMFATRGGGGRGPYLPTIPRDPVSGTALNYTAVSGGVGIGNVTSSASGNDSTGKAFSTY